MAKPDLSSVSVDDIQSELLRRATETREKANTEMALRCRLVTDNIEGLLYLVPKHSGKKCSDEKLDFAYSPDPVTCVRCQLIHIKEEKKYGNLSEYSVTITLNPEKPLPAPKSVDFVYRNKDFDRELDN